MALDSRVRLLKVMKILEEYCNDEQGVSMEDIIDNLESTCSEHFDRKAIYKDIDAINLETDIYVERKTGTKIYKVEKDAGFTREEVEIIINALVTAKFISKEDTQTFINNLLLETGLNRDKTLTKNIRIMDRVKSTNPDVIGNIEKIREAIKKNQKIQFDYVKYDISKKLYIDKQSCIVSPYEDVWYQDYYYMLGNYSDDKISHYRVDRIRNIKLLKDIRKNISEIVGIGREFNAAEYMSKLVGMSSGNEERVVIKFKNEYIGEVIDSLGEGVTILKDGLSHFTLSARVLVNKKFTRWVLGFGDGALVKSPDTLRHEIIQSVECQADLYQIETH